MLTVSLLVEILRTRPRLIFWLAALAQAALWTLAPTFFYAAPPGGVAQVLAVGHEFKLGTDLGPPLAYWAAEIAFRLAGQNLFGVYLLSQVCVVVTYWAVFRLGSAIVGARHAALAILLMVGISALTVPTPDFGPAILAMPLWALALLHYWRAVGEGRARYWFALALDLGLLLLTTYTGLAFAALLAAFTASTERGRKSFGRIEPMLAGILLVLLLFPHLIWIDQASVLPRLMDLRMAETADRSLLAWARLAGALIAGHAGLAVLVALSTNMFRPMRFEAPAIERLPVSAFGRRFVYFFALAPAAIVTLIGALVGQPTPTAISPLAILSALAVIVAGGDIIRLHHQRVAGLAWAGLLLAPPIVAAAAVIVLPWTLGIDLRTARPASEIGRFFTESFERRTGRPFAVVGGDPDLAALIALASPQRPGVYRETSAARSAWVDYEDLTRKGAVIVWPATDTAGTPPPGIKARFPGMVHEIPRAFERRFQGRLPLLRIGWAVVRPQEAATPAPTEKSQ